MCEYIEKSSPESGRCPQVEIRYDKYPPSAGARPPGEIRRQKYVTFADRQPPAEICHGNCCFSSVKHIYCVFLEFYIWNQHWERHGETRMKKLVWNLLSCICFGRDNNRIRAQFVRMLIKVAEIRKLTLASICLLVCQLIWCSNRQSVA